MKIGITCYPTYGGSGIVATELGLELAARGHDVHFISYANPIRLDPGLPRIHYHEVEVSNYRCFNTLPTVWRWLPGWRRSRRFITWTCCTFTTPSRTLS